MPNAASYFEIPVTNMQRAIAFYSYVFEVNFEEDIFDDLEMAYFPIDETAQGISGALVKGEIYKPTQEGVLIYLTTSNIDRTLTRTLERNAITLFPIHRHENAGFAVAEFEDSEGNRIGLYQKL
ncbi:VOC family protein [Myroides sp. 1354]|uniref:VOC family protein n=1 Tax=unclassified Myroides TaxID=2642485 RepID=UPI002578104E|nr:MULTISPECIES: VOC family protein [unclassified Myroides]MDM1046158.1 VOC family protein [Myroides sp. R163-1]MDM1057126.1 VOC family protein [Myroides sp. 1354]MDM1070289.1 VOC family protein [Myroides sp. 1372]